ncbi:hypothetical protein SERLA73DRAFT_79664 [Serpula lacrymans var. lacrymans S7.3]|uniref:Nitrate reductase n=2 Tax=Serpula lacrymans var. lacrymans TaxID=341189 RepID=F8QH56_SERL3|nr:putative NAD(P)H-nitrate reductase [Serpula lacrymans var. lacrymans S7.9]EGN92384.1 hypothetical protein SERLA73DRAFT_79664 [Serpula lacrymans var. lacrymans S7.3]EGO24245.1 putative NAD(P)H-nitrate reductase [Serpula lacrymans var. lacrymans S7.9]
MAIEFLETAFTETSSDGSDDLSSPSDATTSTAVTSIQSSPSFEKAILPESFLLQSLIKSERDTCTLPHSLPAVPNNEEFATAAEPDRETPDNWLKRNPKLIRLTGKHPFNSEAKLESLFDAGFITPAHLHFVRNHGAVPQVGTEMLADWTIRVHGLIAHEMTFTLKDLREQFTVVTLPVTLVCAGNRRKEQNTVRKTLGFSWGAAGVSTALWTGVYLSDILEYVKPRRGKAKYVVFDGGDSLPNGPYGTSQKLSWAANKDKGMLIAWAMNGLPLEPDHGFPVRLVVPGQIGGRSVKWLKGIEISDRESQHHLHFWDNKVLPTQIMPEQVRAEKHWWYDPRYIITELNVNSVIAKPDHNETLQISHDPQQNVSSYVLRGYAYAGGGRRVTRVEVSLDEGKSWTLANIDYPEDLYRDVCHSDPVYGTLDLTNRDTCFCWCFWSYDVSYDVLRDCDALMVRAMDESMALQPRDMYWHALGMMNNWWFRVAIHKVVKESETILQFEHPTVIGGSGGWMERMKNAGEDITKPSFGDTDNLPRSSVASQPPAEEVSMKKSGVSRRITPEELKAQDRKQPWFVVNGEVYDGTPFLNEHPGGGDSIVLVAGEDASEDFMAIHSAEGKALLAEHHIGTLTAAVTNQENSEVRTADTAFLERSRWNAVKLCAIQQVNHDSYLYRFALPYETQELGLPVGQHVFVRLRRRDTGEMVQRAYTPVSRKGAVGFIDFLIKLYLPTATCAAGGKMTTGFHQLSIGDSVELKGPLGSFTWKGSGVALWRDAERQVKDIGMICGGSGITPILQVLRDVLGDPSCPDIRVWLIDANKTEEDILCREELDLLFASHGKDRFKLHYVLGKAPATWNHSTGRINDTLLSEHLPSPSKDGLVLICGPDAMISHTVKPGLTRLGWDIEDSLVVF